VPIGKAVVRRSGTDVSVIASGFMAALAMEAAAEADATGISVEVVDLRTVKPFDRDAILTSVRKTGRAVVADPGWRSFGVASEISATIAECALSFLRAPVRRVTIPDLPAPASKALEDRYYPSRADLLSAIVDVCESRLPATEANVRN
jgi:pyruvate dehydrogenase E1 component beta subunit